jgi:hypothetical protein
MTECIEAYRWLIHLERAAILEWAELEVKSVSYGNFKAKTECIEVGGSCAGQAASLE